MDAETVAALEAHRWWTHLPALTAEQMRDADARACERVGDVALMRAAGERIAELVRKLDPGNGAVAAFAGPGNNGGDAFAACAELAAERPCIVYALEPTAPSAARRDAEERARTARVEVRALPSNPTEARHALNDASVALDALLGTGARLPPPENMNAAIEALCAASAGAPWTTVIAIDVPTGMDATTGACADRFVFANETLMLGAAKLGVLLEPARGFAGRPWVGDLGLGQEIAKLGAPFYSTMCRDSFAGFFLGMARREDADKRSAGAPLIIAGSRDFPGAAVLCAIGAARAGAGYVTVACPEDAADTLRAHLVEQVVVTYDARNPAKAIDSLCTYAERCGSVAIGPGLALSNKMGEIVRGFVKRLELPFVADAGALSHLAKHLDLLHEKSCILTPHAGEFARLSGEGAVAESERIERLRRFVDRTGITTLLKGSATLVAAGPVTHVNPTGTSALATAGTGDVLTGMIATLLAQGCRPWFAGSLAAYWHGLAGREAARMRPRGVVAGDVAEALGAALLPLSFAPSHEGPGDKIFPLYETAAAPPRTALRF
ncbi:MAG: NAD(P)H-hydrate dehydratase [Candidatus Eremiobacteraeota bacterium]|nr:NAD(P)H-hydrate dehydratase [Candidatus Eremiobacteraeota bacterium]